MKKNNKIIIFCLMMIITSIFTGCANKQEDNTLKETKESTVETKEQVDDGMRTITDLAGNTVEIPQAEDINKVIIVAPPLVPTFASVVKDSSKLVGMHPMVLTNTNKEILAEMLPNYESINTTFLTGFASNAEEVLKMDPDIILVYGDAQKEGLENVDIPVVDFFIQDQQNESWSVKIDTLMREIFDEDGMTIETEWADSKEIVSPIIDNLQDGEKKTGLMIMSNTGDAITVRGAGTYGDDWLTKSGLVNVASELEGDSVEVTMEQIYEWDPDIIYIFRGMPSESYINNSIDGQDWSLTSAFANGTIYDMPVGVFNWGAPNADSPLTLQWMVMKNYPGNLDESAFKDRVKTYYERQYGIELTDENVESILKPDSALAPVAN